MVKIKFRVFVMKYCHRCKIKHEMPTHRYIFHQAKGTADEVRQKAHAFAVRLLNVEDRKDKDKKQQRPLWQYDIEVA